MCRRSFKCHSTPHCFVTALGPSRSMFCVARRPIRFLAEFSRNVQSFRDKLVKEANEKHNVPLDVPLSPPPPGHPHRTMYPDLPAVQEETDSTTGSYFSKSNDSLKKTLKIDLIPPKIEITTNHPDPSRTPTESMYHTMGSEAKISSPFAVAEELNGSEAVDFNPFAAQSSRNVSLKKVPASNPMITSSPSIAAKPSTLENGTPLSTFRDSPPDHQQKTKMSSSGINALPWSFESLFRTPQLTTPASSGTGVSNFSPFLSEAFPRTPSKPQTSSKNELQRGKDESSTTQYKECADCNVRHYSEKAWERHLDLRHLQGRKKETSWMTAKTMKTAQEQGTVRLDSDYAVLTSTCSLSAPPEELSEDSLSCISVVCISGTVMRQDEFPSESVARLPLVATEDTMDALICVSCENPPMGETNHDLIHVRCSHNGVETTLGATWRESLREGAHVCVVGQLRMNPQMDAVSSKYYYYPMIYVSPVCGSVTVLG